MQRRLLRVLGAAGLALGLSGAGQLASAGPGAELTENAVIKANYKVRLAKIKLGEFHLTTQIDGTAYHMRGDGKFSLFEGLLYEWHGTTASSGRVTTAGIQPSQYTLSYRGSDKSVEEVQMSFSRGTVSELQLVPQKKPSEHNVPITAKQLQDVLDPMSAAFLFARSDNTAGDSAVCDQTVPVFDGRMRFDIKLTPKRIVNIQEDGYSGPAAICKVQYVPVSGHRPDNPGVQMLSQTDEIEVWMVPMKGTGLYVPYKIIVPTFVGYGTATASSFKVETGTKRASLNQ